MAEKTNIVINTPKGGSNKKTNQAKKSKKRAKKNRSKLGNAASESAISVYNPETAHPSTRQFVSGLSAPDIVGPMRIPRSGASQRTGLAMDRSYLTLGSTTTYSMVHSNAAYNTNCGTQYTAANATTVWGGSAAIPVGSQFPASANILDCNIIATSILVTYIGAPLNCTGEILLGTIPSVGVTSSTFDGLSFYPGVIRLPLASLIVEPLRVSLKKLSPVSNEFVSTGSANNDLDFPFICMTTTAAANVISIQITRTYEYRTAITTSNIIPYEKSTGTFSEDLSRYEDAQAVLAEIPSSVTEGIPEYLREMAMGLAGNYLGPSLGSAAMSTGTVLMNLFQHHRARIAEGRNLRLNL